MGDRRDRRHCECTPAAAAVAAAPPGHKPGSGRGSCSSTARLHPARSPLDGQRLNDKRKRGGGHGAREEAPAAAHASHGVVAGGGRCLCDDRFFGGGAGGTPATVAAAAAAAAAAAPVAAAAAAAAAAGWWGRREKWEHLGRSRPRHPTAENNRHRRQRPTSSPPTPFTVDDG